MAPAKGNDTGLLLPAAPDELAQFGPEWLTAAFRAFGVIGEDNAVAAILRCEPAGGGNSGQKALIDIAWQHSDPALDTALFVKFSRDFADPFRDRRKHELEAEVRLARLSRHPAFPVAVAKAWFADFENASGTGLLVTSRIAFGEGRVEPHRRKCRDFELADPLPYYRATVTSLARLAAAHHTGQLSPELDRLFPYDAAKAAADMPFPWDAESLECAIGRMADLVARAPQLFPPAIADPAFIDRFARDVRTVLARNDDLRAFLHADPRLIALAHWNTNLDNAWFERQADGSLKAGLLDWGMVRVMNAGYGLWGGLCAAEPEMLTGHLGALLALYADELASLGGPELDAETLGAHFDLSLALLGTALLLDVPALLLARMPQVVNASCPRDPALAGDGVVEGFLKVFGNFLALWQHRSIGRSLERALDA